MSIKRIRKYDNVKNKIFFKASANATWDPVVGVSVGGVREGNEIVADKGGR